MTLAHRLPCSGSTLLSACPWVLAPWRGRGVGTALLGKLIELARERRLRRVVLNAQTHAMAFYRRQGFYAEGEEFMDAGIPHRAMRLSMGTATTPRPL